MCRAPFSAQLSHRQPADHRTAQPTIAPLGAPARRKREWPAEPVLRHIRMLGRKAADRGSCWPCERRLELSCRLAEFDHLSAADG